MKLDIYGRIFEVVRKDQRWFVFILGNEGKKRPADNIFIPSHVVETDVIDYLEDLLHEWASADSQWIKRLE